MAPHADFALATTPLGNTTIASLGIVRLNQSNTGPGLLVADPHITNPQAPLGVMRSLESISWPGTNGDRLHG